MLFCRERKFSTGKQGQSRGNSQEVILWMGVQATFGMQSNSQQICKSTDFCGLKELSDIKSSKKQQAHNTKHNENTAVTSDVLQMIGVYSNFFDHYFR